MLARGLSQERNTALMAPISCSLGSVGKSTPSLLLYSALNWEASSFRSFASSSTSWVTPLRSFIWSMRASKYFLPSILGLSETRRHRTHAGMPQQAQVAATLPWALQASFDSRGNIIPICTKYCNCPAGVFHDFFHKMAAMLPSVPTLRRAAVPRSADGAACPSQ